MTDKEIIDIIIKRREFLATQYEILSKNDNDTAFFCKVRWSELGLLLDEIYDLQELEDEKDLDFLINKIGE